MGETMPSENEWLIMEILWADQGDMTASDIIERLKGHKDVSPKTIRVLINRLLKKEVIDYTVDADDARVYHYFPKKGREECVREKSERFVSSYFHGSAFGMMAALAQNGDFSEEQIQELIDILESGKSKGK